MRTLPIILCLLAGQALAATPAELVAQYGREAQASQPGFQASAERGRNFYARNFNVTPEMNSCAACHTPAPQDAGRHAISGKAIKPMAVAANADRFSDPAKVEKWFRRNCSEVVGRECSPGEKADFIAYLSKVKS
jgi:hypothetical protein